jgi:hypothetical protein
MAMKLEPRTVDEELMAYVCLQKLMKVYVVAGVPGCSSAPSTRVTTS